MSVRGNTTRRRAAFALFAALGWVPPLPAIPRTLAADAPAPVTHVVVIEGMKFTPARLEIRPGDRVTFKNSDLVPHTATTTPEQPTTFDSGVLNPGESWTVAPKSKSPIHYACTFHPMMEGVIVVSSGRAAGPP